MSKIRWEFLILPPSHLTNNKNRGYQEILNVLIWFLWLSSSALAFRLPECSFFLNRASNPGQPHTLAFCIMTSCSLINACTFYKQVALKGQEDYPSLFLVNLSGGAASLPLDHIKKQNIWMGGFELHAVVPLLDLLPDWACPSQTVFFFLMMTAIAHHCPNQLISLQLH